MTLVLITYKLLNVLNIIRPITSEHKLIKRNRDYLGNHTMK